MTHKPLSKLTIAGVISGVTLMASSNVFAVATTVQMNSIADSWHNLSVNNIKTTTPNGDTPVNQSNAAGGVCVFCHTPHGGATTAPVPLWNRVLGAPGDYTTYDQLGSTTYDAGAITVGSVTLACLSCHDGTQAMDRMINAPGSGYYDAAGAIIGGGASTMVGADIDAGGVLAAGIVQTIGTDLTNDHPVSMLYGAGLTGTTGYGATIDPDFVGPGWNGTTTSGETVTFTEGTMGVGGGPVWWLERSTLSLNATARDREDVILYTRDLGAGDVPTVECGSCHDPHNVKNPTFLRVSNGVNTEDTGFPSADNSNPSGLCLTCHLK